MKATGVRGLRQRAAQLLKKVEGERRKRFVAQGRLVPGSGDLMDLGAPLSPARGVPKPSELLQLSRAAEP